MSFLDKLAASKEWEQTLEPNVIEERELIRQSQRNDGFLSNESYKKLLSKYRNVISKVAKDTGYNKVVGHDEAMMYGVGVFRELVRDKNKFDLSVEGKPSTKIINHLTYMMKKQKSVDSMGMTKISPELNRKMGSISIAREDLSRELGRDPNSAEIYNYVRNTLGQDTVKLNNIERLNLSIKPELSGSAFVGDGDSDMTLLDIVSQDVVSTEQLLRDSVIEKRYEDTLNSGKFSFAEIDFIKRYFGLSPYRGKMTINAASLNSGLSGYKGEKALERLRDELKRRYKSFREV